MPAPIWAPVQAPGVPFLIRFPANTPEEAVEYSPSVPAPETHEGDLRGILGS